MSLLELTSPHNCISQVLMINLSLSLSLSTYFFVVVVFQWLSHAWLFATSLTAACQAPLSSTISWSLLKFMFIESVMISNHLILCHPLLLLLSISSSIRAFSLYIYLVLWRILMIKGTSSSWYPFCLSFRVKKPYSEALLSSATFREWECHDSLRPIWIHQSGLGKIRKCKQLFTGNHP